MYKGISRIGKSAKSVQKYPQLNPVSKVIISAGENTFSAGTDGGSVIAIDNPFGSQQMAEAILARLNGYIHTPMKVGSAILDPVAELGDGTNVLGTYGGIYSLSTTFGPVMAADIASPGEKEIDSDVPAKSTKDRAVDHKLSALSGRVSGVGKRVDAVDLKYGEAMESLTASFKGVSASLNLYAQHLETTQLAVSSLTSRVDGAEAALVLKASQNSVDKIAEAQATLSVRVGDAEAAIELKASTASVQSLINVKADLINLIGNVKVEDGSLRVSKGITTGGSIHTKGDLDIDGWLYIGSNAFTPQEITSTSGQRTVLAM